jgi:hypothetical protein
LNTLRLLEAIWMKIVDLYLIVSSGQSDKTYEKIECMDLTKEVGICLRSDV